MNYKINTYITSAATFVSFYKAIKYNFLLRLYYLFRKEVGC